MNRFRIALICLPIIAGLIIATLYLTKAQPIIALASIACGALLSAVLLFGSLNSFVTVEYQAAAGIAAMIGIFGTLAYSNLFNSDLQRGYADLMMRFPLVETYCPATTPGLRSVSETGLAACALQNNLDAMNATSDLQKGVHFGPALTLVDSAATLAKDGEVNFCARAFKQALRICPVAFSSMGTKERKALLAAAE